MTAFICFLATLSLYFKPSCPYSQKVIHYLETSGHKVEYINIAENTEERKTLVKTGGKPQVPCLFIDGKPLYESSDIIAWLEKHPTK
ncbi:MAG: glutaredoxin [Chlamydiales bacterium]|nr:glutaredoxin [Chlamydiales bacterium]